MYEMLTCYLEYFDETTYGKWVTDKVNDGSPEHPKHFPFVVYDQWTSELLDAVVDFTFEHKEMKLNRYSDILEKHGLQWNSESMNNADVSALDGQTVMALLVGATRAEHFSEGMWLSFLKNGSVKKWLLRLKELDEKNAL